MNDLASADPNIQIAMFEVISEGVSGGLLVYDRNDLIVFASQQLLSFLSVPKTVLTPGTRLRDFLAAVYDGGGRFSPDASGSRRLLSKDDWVAEQIASMWKERVETLERRGSDRWLAFNKRRLSSGYGVYVVRDVSDHRKREDQWRADMERVQITEEVLDNLPFSVSVKDSTLSYVAINKRAANFHDLPPENILGRRGEDIYPDDLAGRLNRINRNVLETGEPLQLPELVTRPDGSQVVIIAHKYRIGKPGRYYLVTAIEDITDLVETDQDGRKIVPRTSSGDLIVSSLARPTANIPAVAADHVTGTVLVVVDNPRIEAMALAVLGELGIHVSTVSGADELQLFLKLAADAGLHIDLVVSIGLRAENRLSQIARRYGVDVVSIHEERLQEDLGPVVTGALSRNDDIVLDQDGDWQITSDMDDNTIDILVAEDNEVNQIVFSQILEGLGYRYAIAKDGEEALRLWQDRSPRLVLMDVTLPKLTGFEASLKIRLTETLDNSIPIIGVLPLAFDRDRDDCYAAGMNDVILKPISPESLGAVLKTYLDTYAQQFSA